MPITSFNKLQSYPNIALEKDLPIIIHGDISADITLVCYNRVTHSAIEAAEFLNTLYPSITVNVIQINQLDPLPAIELKAVFESMKFLLVIEQDVVYELRQKIIEQVGTEICHYHYLSLNQDKLAGKIVDLVKNTFFISKK